MHNKRIIWLTLFLALCLFGGGFFYSVSREKFPCELGVVTPPGFSVKGIRNELHFLLKRDFLVSRIKKYAETAGIDLSKCERVEVHYEGERGWICCIFLQEYRSSLSWSWSWQFELDKDGALRWLTDIKRNEEEEKRLLAEEKELLELLRDYQDYLVRPQIY